MIPGRNNFICANSWGYHDPNPVIEVHQEGNKVFEVKGTLQCLESDYGTTGENIGSNVYNGLKWTDWLFLTILSITFECFHMLDEHGEVTGQWSGGLYVNVLILCFITVFICGSAERCVIKANSSEHNIRNKTTWKQIKVYVWYFMGVLLRCLILPSTIVLVFKISELVVHANKNLLAVCFLFILGYQLYEQQNWQIEIPLHWSHQLSLFCVALFLAYDDKRSQSTIAAASFPDMTLVQ